MKEEAVKLWNTQDDDPTNHVMMESRFAVPKRELSKILHGAPIVVLDDSVANTPDAIVQCSVSKEFV